MGKIHTKNSNHKPSSSRFQKLPCKISNLLEKKIEHKLKHTNHIILTILTD